jgi:alkanesulfonate monooxygenase SsuD/methylene tetrahydromethanopterin reductase-like flavin-dependent oxidoreductase (luciferase family)
MLALAAREADIVSVMPPGVGSGSMPDLRVLSMRRGVDRVRDVAGNRFGHIELNTLLQRLITTDAAHQAAEDLARQWNMTTEEALDTPWALIGTVDQVADTLRERRERFGLSSGSSMTVLWTRSHRPLPDSPGREQFSGILEPSRR